MATRGMRVLGAVAAAWACLAGGEAAASAPKPPAALAHLQPGGFQVIEQPLRVNVVFVGYQPGTGPRGIDVARFLAALPTEARPRIREPAFFGNVRDLGLHFTYDYDVRFAPRAFEDAFFGYLKAHGIEGPPTRYQQLYNEQRAASRRIRSNLMIDAVDTERWLGAHSGSIGIDARRHTLFFVNWFGRSDFRDHLYNKPGDPDPDTGLTDALNDAGPGDAWGGTTPDDPERPLGLLSRIWFYDASAAVDRQDASWNLDDPRPSAGTSTDYRMPPIWEYGNPNGYRPFDDLTGDLAKLARYVAIDSLFTPSPLYDPAIFSSVAGQAFPALASRIEVDLTGLSGRPGHQATELVHDRVARAKLALLEPYRRIAYEQRARPLVGDELANYLCFESGWQGAAHSCYGDRLDPSGFSDLFLWMSDHRWLFADGDPDYEVPVGLWDVPDRIDTGGGLSGLADDDHTTGAQSFVYLLTSEENQHAPLPLDIAAPANLTFSPTDASHFRVAPGPLAFDPDLGTDLGLGDDDTTELALPFSFPFLGGSYASVHVNSDGNLTFGAGDATSTTRFVSRLVDGPPRIAPFLRDLNPEAAGASVNASVRPDRVVVTWSAVPPYGLPTPTTFQVTLRADGTIAFAYQRLPWPFGTVGIARGHGEGPVNTVRLGSAPPRTYAAGAIVEPSSYGVNFGATGLLTHEVGHHLGLSHPHDGYDWQTGVDFSAGGDFAFVGEGDYSDTTMSYLTQQTDFSQFDRDAIDRDMTSIYVNEANALLGRIAPSARTQGAAGAAIRAADRKAGEALADLPAMNYREAAFEARDAYEAIVAVARATGVSTAPLVPAAALRRAAAGAREPLEPRKVPRG